MTLSIQIPDEIAMWLRAIVVTWQEEDNAAIIYGWANLDIPLHQLKAYGFLRWGYDTNIYHFTTIGSVIFNQLKQ